MKKLFYLAILSVLTIFTGCDPMEDVYNELEVTEDFVVAEAEVTLTEDDYEAIGQSYPNFNSVDQAKELIPGFLSDLYPAWGDGSAAFVTFDIYQPEEYEDALIIYEVTTEDYDSNPETSQYDNFDDEDQIYDLLNAKYPDIEDNTLVSLTYLFYDGSVNELNNGFFYTGGEWVFIQGFTEDEYNAMGESYPNFSSEDEAYAKIPVYLEEKFKYQEVEAGDLQPIMYKLYVDGVTESYIAYFTYNGTEWEVYENVVTQTLQFGHDGATWVPDNTIRYTLTGADFTAIGEEFADTYENPAWSAGNYSNFDRREGNTNYWSTEMILEAVSFILDGMDPNAEEGQKYVVSYAIYNGSAGTEEISVIKSGGTWVLN
jgi:hypothetical protein